MEGRKVSSLHELEQCAETLKNDCSARSSDGYRYVSPILFRGQSRAGWKLETTLERFGKQDISLEEYVRYLSKVKPGIEAYTDRSFKFDWRNQEGPGSTFPLSQVGFLEGQYEFMVYLRHHGFPTPLLDWSRSLYVALFFACSGQDHKDDSALYMYVENLGFGKGGTVGSPEIATLGQYVTSHKRHFIQQSEHTACIGKLNDNWCFLQHESAMGGVAASQDRLEKFVISAQLRRNILRQLDAMNINSFSLFGTEESLMQMLAFREISD
ncbi:FRG domain-containing protein [Xanthomonas euvesicatoria pv. eucalypti]|uniref:FRG domain-containing protein n=1 Tax=Xanthomonas euvesicatoria TaxID=456327 RepID=UPI0026E43BF0|nr:FRG domain-containing protein [Xanthomonas euvesicatoria]MDO7933120.1 FRG domain-containing protein [Xanthomonas euvesicatoria pv. eucalypti]MDO7937448.1 FRG domain-containing protein [Xanthomonas euvesicatoria pv. eucalypti]MDO7941689.1 FRG domain-containing protein [Xanthomonas euvesicatoria pv. eucalypti]MDO7945934.1 FRG domain-containing protein [Xanthomonas euvesicatoria pv. eucalypti]MDO7950460.1 FRG domain-containing protein [Xanthomonas euvesicatoria pv. eucalypti]